MRIWVEPWDDLFWTLPIIVGACRICEWKTLTRGALCADCRKIRELREWSRVNRVFCALVHRDSPLRGRDD